MFPHISDVKDTSMLQALRWCKLVLPLLMILLALVSLGVTTVVASSSTPATVSHQEADAAPSMVPFNGTEYVGWTGRNAAHNLNLMTYSPPTKVFGPAQVLTDTTLLGSGPSLANFNANLYVAWQGTDHQLNVGRYNPADPSHLANKVALGEYSNVAPSLSAFNGRLYVSWMGTNGRLNIISSADARTFNTKVTYGIAIRTSPTVVGTGFYLFIAWEDMSASSHIVIAQYDPSHPANLSAVVTTTSTSHLPIGLTQAGVPAPDLVVAWHGTSDAYIHVGVFEGDSTLHLPVTTTQTISYGPALSSPFMTWTGTDTAQSVNVAMAPDV